MIYIEFHKKKTQEVPPNLDHNYGKKYSSFERKCGGVCRGVLPTYRLLC